MSSLRPEVASALERAIADPATLCHWYAVLAVWRWPVGLPRPPELIEGEHDRSSLAKILSPVMGWIQVRTNKRDRWAANVALRKIADADDYGHAIQIVDGVAG